MDTRVAGYSQERIHKTSHSTIRTGEEPNPIGSNNHISVRQEVDVEWGSNGIGH